jgi:hypothetical protein
MLVGSNTYYLETSWTQWQLYALAWIGCLGHLAIPYTRGASLKII